MPAQEKEPGMGSNSEQAAEHVAAASQLLRSLQTKIGASHPEIREAVNKLEMALAILGVQTSGML